MLRNLVALGIIDEVNGIIFGKPKGETYYEEYKEVLKQVIGGEAGRKNLPILYNVNLVIQLLCVYFLLELEQLLI